VNEFEECCAQALTLTKSLSYVEGCYTGIAESLHLHGLEPTQLLFTDNTHGKTLFCLEPPGLTYFIQLGEVGFHESCTPSLKEKVVHVKSEPYSDLPLLMIPTMVSRFQYSDMDLIDAACFRLLQAAD